MLDPDRTLDPMSAELANAVAKMRKARSLDDRVKWSQIVYNLSQSLAGFMGVMTNYLANQDGFDDLDEFDFEDGLAADD